MEQVLKPDPMMSYEAEMAILVGRYATPLAIFLVGLGLALSQPVSPVKEISVGLLLFSVIFNLGAVRFLGKPRQNTRGFIRLRLLTNLGVNILLVYYLGGYWTPTWLLLVLTPLATAIYESRGKTIAVSLGVSLILLIIHALRKFHSPLEWGEQVVHALFIILVSLLVNELSALVRRAGARSPT